MPRYCASLAGEVRADVAQPRGAQQSVDYCMGEGIAVAVAKEPVGEGHAYATQDQRPSLRQRVNVVAYAHAHPSLLSAPRPEGLRPPAGPRAASP